MSDQAKQGEINLKGQVAIVTGGGRGIGRAIAQSLAAAGAAIAVLARSAKELEETVALIQRAGGRARAFVADVTDRDAVTRAVRETEKTFGPVEILVNNAGAVKPLGPAWEGDPGEWWRTVEVNLRGPFLCTHAVLPGMVSRRRGRIINVSSGAGTIPLTYFSAYVASKTALIRFTECVAAETKPHGIAAFSISPGTVRTAMAEYSLGTAEGQKWLPWFKQFFDEGLDVPAERPARLVLELASGKADALSGRMLSIADDLELLAQHVGEIERDNLLTLRMDRFGAVKLPPALEKIRAEGTSAHRT